MLRQQAELSHTQLQVASGKRILSPSEDPIGSAAIVELQQSIEITAQHQRNADLAKARLELEEGTLGGITNVMQRIRELTIQASNATQSFETRIMIAAELRQRLEQLVSQANTRDAMGEYIFAGTKTETQPIVVNTGGGFSYRGDDGQRFVQISSDRQIADGNSGEDVFMAIREGNGTFATSATPANTGSGSITNGSVVGSFVPDTYTITFTGPTTYDVTGVVSGPVIVGGAYTSGSAIAFNGAEVIIEGSPQLGDTFTVASSQNKDLFSMVDDLITTLETSVSTTAAGSARMRSEVASSLANLDQALGNILTVRSDIGGRLNAIDAQGAINDGLKLQNQSILSDLEDLDYAEAVSRLNLQVVGLQAAQQSFIKIQGLSLFNFLR